MCNIIYLQYIFAIFGVNILVNVSKLKVINYFFANHICNISELGILQIK